MSSIVISGDTSGAVTLTVPATAGTNTVTIPASTGTVMVSSNMPAFSAYLGTAQTITSSVYTLVQYDTKTGTGFYDTASRYNNTGSTVNGIPPWSFMPNVAGYYQVNASVYPNTATTQGSIYIYVTGSPFVRALNYTLNCSQALSALVYCNGTTDYIQIYAQFTGTTPAIGNVPNLTWFQASLVRSA